MFPDFIQTDRKLVSGTVPEDKSLKMDFGISFALELKCNASSLSMRN